VSPMPDPLPIRPLPPEAAPDASVDVPGSKSLTNRALVLAALASGRSALRGALFSDDTWACLEGLRALGVAAEGDPAARCVTVEGTGGGPPAAVARVDVRLSGTTARFLCPYMALGRGTYHVDGVPRMRQRPMGPVWDALSAQGVRIDGGPNLPFTIHGSGGLPGGHIRIAGGETSQPASGMLMVAPYAAGDTVVEVETHRSALPYVAMTARLMEIFGVACTEGAGGTFSVRAGARYRAGEYAIEPDASAAAYFWALAALCGGSVHTPGIGRSRLQGDAAFLGVLERMGCRVQDDGGARVRGPAGGRLRAVDQDMSAMSDQALTLGVLGLWGDGPTTVRNVSHIRLQETDRIAAAATELRRLGARCEERPDGFVVWPLADPGKGGVATVETYGDHRVAMAFALAGLRRPGVRIADPGCVGKTFPEYFDVLDEALGRR